MKLASIETILEVYPHNNADRVEFVKVLGYDCIVSKGQFKQGDKVILIQPDTVLPVEPWTEMYRKHSKNRVKAARFRGSWSFGIVESLALLPENNYEVGQEVSDLLKIVKYEPPAPKDLQAKGFLPFNLSKTDEERYNNLDMTLYYGKIVDITQKIDGQSFSAYYKDGQFGVTGRSLELKAECENNYTRHIQRYDLQNKLATYCQKYGVNLAIRGESYGPGIQAFGANIWSKKPHGLGIFSVWNFDTNKYEGKNSQHYYVNVCKELDLPMVPMLEHNVVLTEELIRKYGDELDKIKDEPFEGVVVKGDDFSFKIINKTYDSLK